MTEYARRAEDRRLHGYEVFDYALNGIAGREEWAPAVVRYPP